MKEILLGVIADDFTGASDIASFLTENGLSTIQINGVPKQPLNIEINAVVISLKSRSNPALQAVEQSLQALNWLKENGCRQVYFKYCSTFDSTAKGNIGPVTDALLKALKTDFTVISPALPINGRTVFNGYLFVGDKLLNESGMQYHPLTPMRDANLIRLMNAQAKGKTGLVNSAEVSKGAEHIKTCFKRLKQQGYRYAVVDAIDNSQLEILAQAVADFPLITGGSGLGAYMAARLSGGKKEINALVPNKGKTLVLSGSCSLMTNQQVNYYQQQASSIYLDIQQLLTNPNYLNQIEQWVIDHLDEDLAPMVYATVSQEKLKTIQSQFGIEKTSQAIESAFAQLAKRLKRSVDNFIIAGGETASIVVQQLEFNQFEIGKQISAGVPWLKAINSHHFLALKSGNFGETLFFIQAQGMML